MTARQRIFLFTKQSQEALLALLRALPGQPELIISPDIFSLWNEFQAKKPQLCIIDTDNVVPEEGLLLKKLSELAPETKFLVCFSARGAELARELRQHGANPIWKPFQLDELYQLIKSQLSAVANKTGAWSGEKFAKFVLGLSDQVNNPLSTISGYLQLLAVDLETKKDREMLLKITTIQESLEKVTQAMEQLSFISGLLKPKLSKQNLAILIRERIKQTELAIQERLQLDLPKTALFVDADMKWLGIGLDNLFAFIANVADAMQPMQMQLQKQGSLGGPALQFQFHSARLEQGMLARLFEPYAIAQSGLQVGLLLTVAQTIARSHNSNLNCEMPEPGKFQFTWDFPQ